MADEFPRIPNWPRPNPELWPEFVSSIADADRDARYLDFRREGTSQKGLGDLAALEGLYVEGVNQAVIDEVGRLHNLRYLNLNYPVTAPDLSPILALPRLEHLRLEAVRKPHDYAALSAIPTLTEFAVEHPKGVDSLEQFAASRVRALGVSGSMWTTLVLEGLSPLAGMEQLEFLDLTNVRLRDTDLSPLHDLPNLRELACARFAPRDEFERLRAARPDLICTWCDDWDLPA